MPILATHRMTTDRYQQRVMFGERPMLLRPQSRRDQWLFKIPQDLLEAAEARAERAACLTAASPALVGHQRSRSAVAIQTATLPRQPCPTSTVPLEKSFRNNSLDQPLARGA